MTTGRYREEVLNVVLALLLHERGVVAVPEQSFKAAVEQNRRVPDVLVNFRGLRTVIEGKVDDQPDAAAKVVQQTQERVEKGIAHIGVAVLYPAFLRKTPFPELPSALSLASLRIAVFNEATPPGEAGWSEGGLDYLADLLRRTYESLVKEDVVNDAVGILDSGISAFVPAAFPTDSAIQRAAQILGIGEPPQRTRRAQTEDEE